MSRSSVTLLLLLAIVIAAAVAAIHLGVPVLVAAVGAGALCGAIMAYAASARRARMSRAKRRNS
jgi:hydroxyethylthiazole kinase-like sugar kinase family protein